MVVKGDVIYSVSHTTVLFLCFLLAALLILLFFSYKYLNKEANDKYTIQRIVFREGGLRDRARGATVALGNRLGVQLWPQSAMDQDEEDAEEAEDGEDEEDGQGDSNGDEVDSVKVNAQKSDSAAPLNNVRRSSEHDSVDESEEEEEEEALVKPEAENTPAPDQDRAETSGPVVINLNQFSGGVHWSEEDGDKDVGDVTAL